LTIVVVTVLCEFQIVVDVTYAAVPVGYTTSYVPETVPLADLRTIVYGALEDPEAIVVVT